MDYLYLLFTIVCLGGQFSLVKLYQTRVGNGLITSFLYSLFAGIIAAVLLLFVCGFQISINLFAFLTASGVILCVVGYTVIGMKMMSIGKVAAYTMFLMLGGMFVPFLYGVIFLDEPITVWKIAGIILLFIALLVPALKKSEEKSKNVKLFTILGIAVFILNGMVSVFSKMHQISPNAISTFEFGFWQNIISTVTLSAVIPICAFFNKEKNNILLSVKKAMPLWWIIILYALLNQGGGILLLFAAKTVDASVMYPIVTGGVMVVTALCGLIFYREKLDKYVSVSLLLSVISTVLFII